MSSGYAEAAVRRDDGMQRAVAHADQVEPNWQKLAGDVLKRFLWSKHAGDQFMVEDAREWMDKQDLPIAPPPDSRAWGHVVRRLASEGFIKRAGYAPARSSNLSPKCVWEIV